VIVVYKPITFSIGLGVHDTSLKSVVLWFAEQLGLPPAAFYERQRVLVRAGLLESRSGRGPGSGVRATPESVARMLIAILSGGPLSDTPTNTRKIANLKSTEERCPFTGKRTFESALAATLESEELASKVAFIDVDRAPAPAASIVRPNIPEPGKYWVVSQFGSRSHPRKLKEPLLEFRGVLFFPFDALARRIIGATK
jgi:hypothetical protein